ncbi:glutamate synthase-related protein [Deinococcus murrayi]|uniref:glutamate synthase-related protein n=1 Tax=Deinococcus murrayi TaxID=68910 RepID=UPI0009FCE467|nr:glutamate synthase-related protein [Deinococcus murrayi]
MDQHAPHRAGQRPQEDERRDLAARGLYAAAHEHDACGVGFVAHLRGEASHGIIRQALQVLENLDHRGAVGADELMGDGAGLLMQIPDALYREEMAAQGVTLPPPGGYGVGMVFLPKEPASRLACEQELERAVRAEGQVVLGWRDVPVREDLPMSPAVRATEPVIRQLFIGHGPDVLVPDALERKLYVIRKRASLAILRLRLTHGREYYVPSMSCRTVIYKGLLLAHQVGEYYRDLADERAVSALALVHQRFSTNTFPEWFLAHPYRMVAHNGEINTVQGNFNWMRAREGAMRSPVLGEDLAKLYPVSLRGQSDTATFDNALELLVMAGYPLAHAVALLIPEAWEGQPDMDPARRAFYEYHAPMLEPWDGPAAMVFTDGRSIGATLDRNGLRPARYLVTDDDLVVLASESGVLPIPEGRVVYKGRLQPGRMFLLDPAAGRILDDAEIKGQLAGARPYAEWTRNVRVRLAELTPGDPPPPPAAPLTARQRAFGYTAEDLKFVLTPLGAAGEEGVGSMGNDSPLAVLSGREKPLSHYFRQRFAQVTNPPIDPIREAVVMSLMTYIGPRPNLLDVNGVNPPLRLEAATPLLDGTDMARLRAIAAQTGERFRPQELSICYPAAWGAEGIEASLASLRAAASDAVRGGASILILTDRGVDASQVAIPAPLALSAVHQHLIREGLRTQTGLVAETGAARSVHDFAVLAGYGAEAVHPYLALETVAALFPEDPAGAQARYLKGVGKGLAKILSKMGISTYRSYCGAQMFEAVGLSEALVQAYFRGTPTQVGGLGVFEVAEEALRLHRAAFAAPPPARGLDVGGEYAWRAGGEEHAWTPDAVAKLQHAVRSGRAETYREYAAIINDASRRLMTLRGLLELRTRPERAVPLEEVEPAAEIVKRFATGAMSLGSISTEAHVTLAVAMNRIGGKSNTGEGGEDPARYRRGEGGERLPAGTRLSEVLGPGRVVPAADYPLEEGDSLRSRIKQVASGRFGVTTGYLVSADQIQIKMAQGAKPGEGGQLPGGKVTDYIGELRHSVPGVGLISPPPHHDIYSIEDLAQLIHDLKNVNPAADVSVKLVAEVGVGTVAAGVAKARADHIVIAGHDGGTGASPWSSIKHAGSPWELGLAETQQTLVLNRLRGRVRLQVDGQIKTGRDVVIGALLGADEFGFATAPLVAQGCIMMRKCHLNTCPVGVATQDPVLRAKFAGKPEHVINYLFFVAEEVRELMAALGVRRFEDLVGRVDLLDTRAAAGHWKARGLDLSRVLHAPAAPPQVARRHTETQEHGLARALDRWLLEQCRPALERGERVKVLGDVRNVHRTVGAMLSGELVRRWPDGLPDGTIFIQLEGTAGQSFGAFLAPGVTLYLIGDANDYVGKGLSGGRVVVRPSIDFRGDPARNVIAGNTVLYGATAGEAFLRGVAGERFAVRLSGATAVVEGVGDHGCEYMTGGTVVVLGKTGRNFAAGMSGGVAYVYDEDGGFAGRCNPAMVSLDRVLPREEQEAITNPAFWHRGEPDEVQLRRLLEDHHRWTGSTRARDLLADWDAARARFIKVFPREYERALGDLARRAGEEGPGHTGSLAGETQTPETGSGVLTR